jgi:hypothetical protein
MPGPASILDEEHPVAPLHEAPARDRHGRRYSRADPGGRFAHLADAVPAGCHAQAGKSASGYLLTVEDALHPLASKLLHYPDARCLADGHLDLGAEHAPASNANHRLACSRRGLDSEYRADVPLQQWPVYSCFRVPEASGNSAVDGHCPDPGVRRGQRHDHDYHHPDAASHPDADGHRSLLAHDRDLKDATTKLAAWHCAVQH